MPVRCIVVGCSGGIRYNITLFITMNGNKIMQKVAILRSIVENFMSSLRHFLSNDKKMLKITKKC